jgi:hypothetical protein
MLEGKISEVYRQQPGKHGIIAWYLDEREKPGFCTLDGRYLSCCKLAHVASC